MNIAFFVSNLNNYSGASYQALALAKNLSQNCSIYFFNKSSSSGYRGPYKLEGFNVVDLPKNRLLQLLVSIYFSIRSKITIVHMHGFSIAGFSTAILLRCKSILKTTLIGYDDFETWSYSTSGRLKLFFLRFLDINIVLTQRALDINRKYAKKTQTKKIPNGVNCTNDLLLLKERIFCIVGIIHPRKNTLEAIKYYIKNYASLGDNKLYVVGPLNNEDKLNEFSDSYIYKCRQLVRENRLESKVIFTGKISKNEVQRVYQKSMGLLFFSSSEGMPNVVLEAISNNCVPIMTELDGDAYEIIENNVDGFIIKDYDQKVPLNKIKKLLETGNAYKKSSQFSFQNVASEYAALYRYLNNE